MQNSGKGQGAAPKSANSELILNKAERQLIEYCRKHGFKPGRSLRQQLIDEWFLKSVYATLQAEFQREVKPYMGDFSLEWKEEFCNLQTMIATSPATAIMVENEAEVGAFVVSMKRLFKMCQYMAYMNLCIK